MFKKIINIPWLTWDTSILIMEGNPGTTIKLLTGLAKRLAHIENLMQNLATKNPKVRVSI